MKDTELKSVVSRLRHVAGQHGFDENNNADVARAFGLSRARITQLEGRETAGFKPDVLEKLTEYGFSSTWLQKGILPRELGRSSDERKDELSAARNQKGLLPEIMRLLDQMSKEGHAYILGKIEEALPKFPKPKAKTGS